MMGSRMPVRLLRRDADIEIGVRASVRMLLGRVRCIPVKLLSTLPDSKLPWYYVPELCS